MDSKRKNTRFVSRSAVDNDIPKYCQFEEGQKNVFQELKQEDNRISTQIIQQNKPYLTLGDPQKFYIKNIRQNIKLNSFYNKCIKKVFQKQSEKVEQKQNDIKENTFLKFFNQNFEATNKIQKQYKLDMQRRKIQAGLSLHLQKLENEIEANNEQPDEQQKKLIEVQKKQKQYEKIWNQHSIKDTNPQKQFLKDQEDLKSCLGLDHKNVNQTCFLDHFKQSLRAPTEQPKKQKNRYYNHQFRPLTINNSKWANGYTKEEDIISNKNAIYDYYIEEAKNKGVSEVNQKNKTFITEYARQLSEKQKFDLICKQMQNADLGSLKYDFPTTMTKFCKKEYCQQNQINQVDGNLISFYTKTNPELAVNGRNQFELEKKAALERFSVNEENSRLEAYLDKIKKFKYQIQIDDNELITDSKKPFFYIQSHYVKQ